jgi:hypothetical protein
MSCHARVDINKLLAYIKTLHFTKSAQYARALYYTRLKRLASDKYSSFLGPFLGSEEIEEL